MLPNINISMYGNTNMDDSLYPLIISQIGPKDQSSNINKI